MWRVFYSADRRRSVVLPSFRGAISRPIFSGLTLVVFSSAFGLPQGGLRAATDRPIDVRPPEDAPSLGRTTFGLEFYEHQIDSSLDTLVPLATPQNGLFYLNPKLSVSDRLNPSVSIGLGYRHLFEGPQIILGGNIFYDSDYTNFDHHVNQFGFGAEVLSRWVDFRANYYLPEQNQRRINTKQTTDLSQKVTSSTQALGPLTTSDTVGFAGHNLVETINGFNQTANTFNVTNYRTTHFWEQYEGAMRGVDTEVGFLIPGLDKYAETRIFGGYYYYENPFGKNYSGFKGRLEVRALPSVTLDAAYYQDKEIVGSNWYYGVRVSTPFDIGNIAHGKSPFAGFAEGFKPQHTSEAERFAARLSENVIRNSHVATSQSKFIEVGKKTEIVDPPTTIITGVPFTKTIVLTLDGTPITITHVESGVAVAGDGTFEHPYQTLTLADADAVKRAIVLLHADSTFNNQSITLAVNQQLLGDAKTVTNMIQTDQKGLIALPHPTNGVAMPTITNPGGTIVTVADKNVISGLNLTNAARGISAPSATTGVTVRQSTISNMSSVGIGFELNPTTNATISDITFSANNKDIALTGSGATIANLTSTGAVHGSLDLVNTSGTTTVSNVTVTGAADFAVRSMGSAAGSTHNFSGLKVTGGDAGVDVEGGAGTLNFDSTSTITNTNGASLLVNGGSATVNYGGNITQAMNAPAVAVLGGHTGTVQFAGGTIAASAGPGLQFNNANGTYNFGGTTTLTGGANLQILANSAGTFGFGTGASIVNGAGQDILIDNSTASLQYSGSASANADALLQVNNHTTGTLQFDTGTLSATGGSGLQFNNADGTYKFLGTATLTGTTAGVSLTNGSDGTFAFDTATTITNPTGTAFFVNGGTSNITYSGNITANSGFALQVINHSTGTIAFNTGNITQTAGIGVQFTNDSGIYALADTRVSNSAGSALEVTNSATGTFTFATVALTNSAGSAVNLINAGTVKLLGGTINGAGGNGIFSQNTTLTATGLALGSDHATTINGVGVLVLNNDGTARTVTVSNNNIRSSGNGIQSNDSAVKGELTLVLDGNTIETTSGGSKAISLAGNGNNSTIVKSMNGGTVIANGSGGGIYINRVTFDASGAALTGTAVNAGNWNIGQGTAANQRVLNDGLHLDNPTGDLEFGTLNIFNNAGTGLFVNTKVLATTFTIGSTGGVIDSLGGAATDLDPLTTHLTFTSVTSTNSGGAGVIVNGLTAGSTLTIGTTTVTNAAGDGILVQNSAGATMNFGTTNITNVGGDGINLTQAGNANVIFGATTINGFGAANAGVDFKGSDVTATFGVTEIQNNGNGIAIDLSGSQNNRTITFATGSNIHDVAIGVELSGGGVSANSNFTFGDGTAANGKGSFINAPVTVDATNLNPATGTYNFNDVNFTGTANFPAIPGGPTFVSATAVNGVGDGSLANPYSVHDADLITAAGTNFVFLDGTYNFVALNGGAGFSLSTGQNAAGLDNGNSITFGSAQQANILGDFGMLSTTVNRGNTGNGTLTITNGAGSDVFDLLGSNQFIDLTLSGSGGATHIINVDGGAGGFNNGGGITISGTTIGNLGAGSTALNFVNATGSISATGNNITAGNQTLVSVNGGTATYTIDQGTLPGGATPGTLAGGSIVVQNTTGGSFETTGAALTTNGNTAVTLNGNAATTTFTGTTITRAAGDTAFNIDATTASTGKVTVGAGSTIDNTAGKAFQIGAGARDIDASAVNITNNGSTGGVIAVTGQSGGTISFGNITNNGSSAGGVISTTGQTGGTTNFGNVAITGYTGGGTAVNHQGTGGAVNYTDLDITTTNGSGLNVGAVTFNPGSSATINATGGPALVMNGTTVSGGTETFSSVTGTNPGAGNASISLTNVAGSTTFTTVDLSGTSATGIVLNNAGTVAVLGGTIIGPSGDGITSTNTTLTATGLTIGATVQPFGNGITIVNNDGTARVVNLSNNTITAEADGIHTTDGGHAGELSLVLDGDTITSLAGGTLAISVTGGAANSTTVNSMNGGTIIGIGSSGGVLFNRVTFDAVTGGAIQQVTGGTWNIGQGTAANARVAFNGLEFEAPTGDLAFNTLNIFNNTGTGLLVNTKTVGTTFSLSSTGGTINTANGAAMNLDPLTTHITLTSVSSVSSPTSGVIVDGLSAGSTLTIGSTTVNTSTGDGIVVRNSAGATFDFGTTNVISSGQDGIDLTQAGNANVTFGATTINGFGAANAGVNFAGSDVTATFGVTSIQNGGNGTGIDLSSTQNGRTITFAKGSSITNVNVGVQLSSSHTTATSANANFTFGDGEGVVDKASTISATTTVDAIGLNPASGTYNFQDVNFTGTAGFQAAPSATFVSATAADGAGNGTFTNPYSVHDADAITTAGITFAFLDGNYDMVTLNGANAFTLSTNQIVSGLDNGNTFSFGLIQPANVLGDFGPLGGTVARGTPGSGTGSAISITNGAGGVFVLGNGNTIMDVTVAGGSGTTSLFFGSGINGVSIHDTTLTNTGPGATFSFVNSTGTITLTNNKINTTGGRLLDVDGGTANITLTAATNTGNGAGTVINNGGNGIRVVNTTGGSVTLTNLQVTNSATTTLTFDNNDATFAITGSKFGAAAGITLLNVDATSPSTTALVFDGTNSFTQTSGAIAIIGAGARDIDLSAQNFTNTGSTVASVISVTGQAGGTISFGNVGITGYNNAAGTAVSLAGTAAGTVTFTDLDIATTAGVALNVGANTFNPGSSSTLSSNGATALIMNGTTAQGGAISFAGVTSSGGATGLSLTNTLGSFTFTNIAISNKTANGVTLSNAGTVNITGGTINGITGNGIDATNSTLNVGTSQLQIGNTAAITGDGIHYNVTDGNAHALNVFNADIRNVGGMGINATHSGSGVVTVSVSSTGISSAGTALNVVKSGTGALNFSAISDSFASSGGLGMNVNGTAGTGVLSVTQASDDNVTAAASGGIVFNGVVFDADTTTAGIQAVSSLGFNISNTTGAGLAISNTTGTLAMDSLFISNTGGTGLIVLSAVNISSTHGGIATTNGAAMSLTNATLGLVFDTPGTAVSSTNSGTSGVIIGTGTSGSINLGGVSVTGATVAGVQYFSSAANVTASSISVQNSATGLQFGTNTGTFTVSGTTSLTGLTGTGINANSATGTYSFVGNTTIGFSGAGRGIDFRSSNLTSFQTGNLQITGDGVTAGSIAIDLSGSQYPGAQPVGTTSPNIKLANGAGQVAAISGVTTGVKLGDTTVGSAGAYLRYGNQTSGSSIAVNAGGVTIDTTNLTTFGPSQQGRYEFNGVTFTGKATFEQSNPNFIFVGSSAAGAANGTNPNNRISIATFLASDNNSAFLANKTVIFVNDGAAINFGSTTLALGTNTVIEGFGNNATVVVPGGVQPANVIGTFTPGGGSFSDSNGAATLTASNTTNVITLSNGNTVQDININAGNNQIIGTGINGFTMSGVNQTNAAGSAITLTNATGIINMASGTAASISGAAGTSFNISGGNATITYSGSITNTSGRLVSIQGLTGGSVTLTGNLSGTAFSTGILVQNNTGGTIQFQGASKILSTGTNQAVALASNTGATILFTNGGLNITTTSGTGFGATGGGDVGLSGTGNTITSGSGLALAMNGMTVDTIGFTLQSVSENGGLNAITLNNLTGGGAVGVKVTGTGTPGTGGTIQNTTGTAITLNALSGLTAGVTLNNLNITGGGGISGSTFGTLSTTAVSLSATNAAALSLTGGAFATGSTFSLLSSSGGTNGVSLTNVTGDFLASAGSITGSTGAAWLISGGSVSTAYHGNITQTANAALVSISGGHTGTVNFLTGALDATGGTGLQFDNADGTYNFNVFGGTTKLHGGDAGIDILNGSDGNFTFAAGVTITNPTGGAFKVDTGTATVTFLGTIANNAGRAILVQNTTGGLVSLTGASLTDSGTGIEIAGAQGGVTVAFTTTTMSGNGILIQGSTTQDASGSFIFDDIALGNAITGTMFHVVNNGTHRLTGTVNLSNVDITSTDADRTVLIEGMGTNGSVIFDSASVISATGSNNNGILVQNNDTGTGKTVTFGGAITATTGANAAINLITNTGTTINFTGGLNLTTTNGTGFLAGAGGTVNVTQNNTSIVNTITSSTGTALNISNTTIGASNVTFRSISSGASTGAGIILDGTGTSGKLVVTGNGTAGSGGTIANKTGADILTGTDAGGQTVSGSTGTGIFLRNTANPTFSWMQLNDFSNFAIYGNNVTGFNLDHTVINGVNGGNNAGDREEASIRFDNLLGTASITNSTVSGGAWGNIGLFNTSGTLTRLTLNANTFGLISTTLGNDNVSMQVFNSAVANITATNNTFSGTRSDFFEAIANNNATMDVVVRSNTFQNGQAIIPGGGVAVSVRSGSGGNVSAATTTFDISNNVDTGGGANAFDTVGIFVAKGEDNGTLIGTIQGNSLVAQTGSNSDGIFVRSAGNGTVTVLILNNTITNWGNVGIHLQNNDGSSTMNASVFGNSVTAPGASFPFEAFFADNGATAGDTNTMNLVLGSANAGETAKQNTFVGGPNAAADVGLSNFNASTHFNLSKNGSAGATATLVVQDDNVGSPTVDTSGGVGPITLVNTVPALPPVVAPLLLGAGGTPAVGSNGQLTQSTLNLLGDAAISVWASTGLTAQQTALLNSVTFSIGDLPAGYVGEALPGQVILSSTAAGQSWYIDSTPLDNSEFTGTGTKLIALAGSPAAGRVDAFTVVLHEVGHELGLDDTYLSGNSSSLMYGYVNLGERRLPASNQALGATPTSSFADALQLGAPSPAPANSGSWKPAVIVHPPVAPTFVVPKGAHTIDLPTPAKSAGTWIVPAFGDPSTIYLRPEVQSTLPTALEIDPAAYQPREEKETGTQTQNSPQRPAPLSSTGYKHQPAKAIGVSPRDAYQVSFTDGGVPLPGHLR